MEWERKLKYAAPSKCHQAKEKIKKEIRNSLSICSQPQKAAYIMAQKIHIP
jgi:hypothetical protein